MILYTIFLVIIYNYESRLDCHHNSLKWAFDYQWCWYSYFD